MSAASRYFSNKYPCMYCFDVVLSNNLSTDLSVKAKIVPKSAKLIPLLVSWIAEPSTTEAPTEIICESNGLEIKTGKDTQRWRLNMNSKLSASDCNTWLLANILTKTAYTSNKILRLNVEDAICKAFIGFWAPQDEVMLAVSSILPFDVLTLEMTLNKLNKALYDINCQCTNVLGGLGQVVPGGFGPNGAEPANSQAMTWSIDLDAGPYLALECDCPITVPTVPCAEVVQASPGAYPQLNMVSYMADTVGYQVGLITDFTAPVDDQGAAFDTTYTVDDNESITSFNTTPWDETKFVDNAPTTEVVDPGEEGTLLHLVFAEGTATYIAQEARSPDPAKWLFVEFNLHANDGV